MEPCSGSSPLPSCRLLISSTSVGEQRDSLVNLTVRFGLLHVGIWLPEISEQVATTAHQLEKVTLFGHCCGCLFTRFSRSRMSASSFFGVRIPVLAFFWKACSTQTSIPSCPA